MDMPPIEPIGSNYASHLNKEIPIRDRVHSDLFSIQQTHTHLQIALTSNSNPSYINDLLQQLHLPVQDLLQIANKRPPVLSQNEIDVVNAIQIQFQLMQTNSEPVSPSVVALLQGNASTLDQLFIAEVTGIPEPNVQALQAQNCLSYLSHTLHLHVKASEANSAQSEAIINSMQEPLKELIYLSKSGAMTVRESDVVIALTTLYNTAIQPPSMVTPEAINQFQDNLQSLNHLLTT